MLPPCCSVSSQSRTLLAVLSMSLKFVLCWFSSSEVEALDPVKQMTSALPYLIVSLANIAWHAPDYFSSSMSCMAWASREF